LSGRVSRRLEAVTFIVAELREQLSNHSAHPAADQGDYATLRSSNIPDYQDIQLTPQL